MKNVVIRADGSREIGLGHVMRCITLAGALKEKGIAARFLTKGYPGGTSSSLIKGAGFDCREIEPDCALEGDLAFASKAALDFNASLIICDGYSFDTDYYAGLKAAGLMLVVIDDLADRPYPADLLLNQNAFAAPGLYEGLTGHDTRLLLGTKYCLVRREFLDRRRQGRTVAVKVGEILVTLGGADPEDHTLKVLEALDPAKGEFKVTVVLGAANPNVETIRGFAASSSKDIEVIAGAGNMAELMARADIGITGGGTTSWETACLGLPTLMLSLAENQEAICRVMDEKGASVCLGRAEEVDETKIREGVEAIISDPAKRAGMAESGMALVDGEGALRVAEEVAGLMQM